MLLEWTDIVSLSLEVEIFMENIVIYFLVRTWTTGNNFSSMGTVAVSLPN